MDRLGCKWLRIFLNWSWLIGPFFFLISTTVVLTEKAIAFCNDKTETWLDVAFANKTKPKYESTEQLVAKGLFPGAVALPEPSRASQSPAAFECSQALEGTPPLFSEVRRDSLCPHDG